MQQQLKRGSALQLFIVRTMVFALFVNTQASKQVTSTPLHGRLALLAIRAGAYYHGQAQTFGPGNCVSTWRNQQHHCMVQTQCKDQNIADYSVKLICVDKQGEKVRHVFGKNSFDSEETFDTLIVCDQCLGDEESGNVTLPAQNRAVPPSAKKHDNKLVMSVNNTITDLVKEVAELKAEMANASATINALNQRVFNVQASAPAPAPAPAPRNTSSANASSSGPAPAPQSGATKLLVHRRPEQQRRGQKQQTWRHQKLRGGSRKHPEVSDRPRDHHPMASTHSLAAAARDSEGRAQQLAKRHRSHAESAVWRRQEKEEAEEAEREREEDEQKEDAAHGEEDEVAADEQDGNQAGYPDETEQLGGAYNTDQGDEEHADAEQSAAYPDASVMYDQALPQDDGERGDAYESQPEESG